MGKKEEPIASGHFVLNNADFDRLAMALQSDREPSEAVQRGMNHTEMLIANENEGAGVLMVLITDPHGKHVLGHLKAIWRFRVLKHVIEHLVLWRRQRIAGLPSIEINID